MSVLDIEGLSCWYKSSSQMVLKQLDLQVHEGELVVIKGSNGSGKSTLLHAIANYKATNVRRKFKLLEYSDKPSLIIQDPKLQILSFHVVEEIALRLSFQGVPRPSRIRKVEKLLEQFDMQHLRNRDPNHLSSGEQQIVITLASIIDKPRLILMDEPFTFLDEENLATLKSHILSLLDEGYTILISTHLSIMDTFADKIINLDQVSYESNIVPVRIENVGLTHNNHKINATIGYSSPLLDISKEFTDSGLYVIKGQNGSGKTCLLQTIASIIDPISGVVNFPSRTVYVPQRTSLLFSQPTVSDELGDVPVPSWLETYLEYSPFQLSIGYQKILAIYISLHNFNVVCLDEPFQSMDKNFQQILAKLLKEFSEKRLILISSNKDLNILKITNDEEYVLELTNL